MRTSGFRIAVPLLGCLLCIPVFAQVTQRVSVDSGGVQSNSGSGDSGLSVSGDGRYVAFASRATNLVPGDTNGTADVFIRDRWSGTTARVSVSSSGVQANDACSFPSISADGRYVAFESPATTLVAGDTNGTQDIFLHDLQTGATTLVSLDPGGAQANDYCTQASISADGRYVAFASYATNLVSGDSNGKSDIFLKDLQSGAIERVSVATGGAQANQSCGSPSVSADGRYVAFESSASNLVLGDTNGVLDIFVRDRQLGQTVRASVSTAGVEADGYCIDASISQDGRYVAFHTVATNLVPAGHVEIVDLLVRDLQAATTERAGSSTYGPNPSNPHVSHPSISGDGRYVAFDSDHPYDPSDTNGRFDIYVRDLQTGGIERVNVSSAGAEADLDSEFPCVSSGGRYVVFGSNATDLVAGDTNHYEDVFLRDRDATGFTSLCDPGVGGVIACPCSNPPSGLGRGCDNSAATGGAALSASGVSYLSLDSLEFTTSGEKPTATSIVLQGTTSPSAGVIYGQGVRCVGGALKRLFTKTAVGGSITAPDFGAGDPTVSARSAAKGDVIQPGQSRWYLVYYRDPVVPGGCSASSTFNATQTGRVDWSL